MTLKIMATKRQLEQIYLCNRWVIENKFKGNVNSKEEVKSYLEKNLPTAKERIKAFNTRRAAYQVRYMH